MYGMPKRAMMKPVLQIKTNNGAANASIEVADFMKWTKAWKRLLYADAHTQSVWFDKKQYLKIRIKIKQREN